MSSFVLFFQKKEKLLRSRDSLRSTVIDDAVPACAMLHFIVMDHDLIGRNDFAGEAFIRLDDVPGFAGGANSPAGHAGTAALRQFNLLLMHPEHYGMLQ